MGTHRDVRFVSSGVKLPCADAAPAPAPAPTLLSAALPFARIGRAIDGVVRHVARSLPRLPVARAETGAGAAAAPIALPRRQKDGGGGGGGEERVLISEVAVRGKDGEPLERPELEAAAAAALRACRPNAALTVREVQEDVHRVVESGRFRSCMPVAVDTRDGIRLVFEVRIIIIIIICSFPIFSSSANLGTDYCTFWAWFRWSRTRTSMGWSVRVPTCCHLSS